MRLIEMDCFNWNKLIEIRDNNFYLNDFFFSNQN